MMNVILVSVIQLSLCVECHFVVQLCHSAECHSAECHGAFKTSLNSKHFYNRSKYVEHRVNANLAFSFAILIRRTFRQKDRETDRQQTDLISAQCYRL